MPVPVVTTSGTAAVNLHPAVVEADYSGVPLVALTADRPPELRGVGANQTIDQVRLYGDAVALFVDLPAADERVGQVAQWRAVAAEAARGVASTDRCTSTSPLREPLVPDGSPSWVEPLDAGHRAHRHGQGRAWPPGLTPLAAGAAHRRGRRGRRRRPRRRGLAEAGGWPLLAEPSSGRRAGPNALGGLPAAARPARRRWTTSSGWSWSAGPTLSRPVTRLLARADVELVLVRGPAALPTMGRSDVVVTAAVAPGWAATAAPRALPDPWLQRWLDADAVASKVVADIVDAAPELSGPAVARVVAAPCRRAPCWSRARRPRPRPRPRRAVGREIAAGARQPRRVGHRRHRVDRGRGRARPRRRRRTR